MSITPTTRADNERPGGVATPVGTNGPEQAVSLPEAEPLDSPVTPASAVVQPWDTYSDMEQPTRPTSIWGRRGVWLGLAAFAVAAVGEALLFPEDKRGLGVILLLAGALVGVAAWNGRRSTPLPDIRAGRRWWRVAWRRELALRLAGIAAAVGLAIGSIVAYVRSPNEIFGWQGVLWLAGVGVLVASCARWYGGDEGRRTKDEGSSAVDDGSQSSVLSPQSLRWTWGEMALFGGLVVLSLVTHLAFLDQVPWRMHFDEGYAFIEVIHFYRGPVIPLFTTTWEGTSLPSLWFGIEGLLMHLTGPNLAGVRLGVALAGAVTAMPVYGLGRLLAGRAAGAIAAFFVAISAVYIHYSRVSIINVTTALAWAVCFYFLVKGLGSRRPGDFVWAGLAAGLSMYTYYGTRLLPYLLVAFFVYMLAFHLRATRERLGHFALAGVGFLVGFGPLLGYFILNPNMWAARGLSVLNVPAVIPTTWDGIVADWNVLAPLAWRDFLGLSVIAGQDNVFFAPFLLPWEAALLVLGVGILVWRWRQPASFLVLLWGFGVVLTGGILVDATTIPSFAHWSPAFPAFYLALALPLAMWWEALGKLQVRTWRRVGAGALVLFLAVDLGLNAYAYLVQYPPRVPGDHSEEAAEGRFVESVGPNTDVYVGSSWAYTPLNPVIDEMMSPAGTVARRMLNPGSQLPVAVAPRRNLAFFFYDDMYGYIDVLKQDYPGGRAGEARSPDGTVIGETYFVPADAVGEK